MVFYYLKMLGFFQPFFNTTCGFYQLNMLVMCDSRLIYIFMLSVCYLHLTCTSLPMPYIYIFVIYFGFLVTNIACFMLVTPL